ncbi:MAG: ABC transporter ATP-binding protein [Aggregatilineales bacterium]
MAVVSINNTEFDMQRALSENRLKGLWLMMEGFRWQYGGAMVALGVSAVARVGAYLLIAQFVDEVLPGDNILRLALLYGLGFILLSFVQGSSSYISGRWAAYTAESVAKRLRDYLFNHVQRMSFTYHDKMQTGELLQRCTSDVDAVRRFYVEQGAEIGRITLLFIVNFAAIMMINVPLAFASVVVIPFVLMLSTFFFKRISDRYEAFQNQEAVVSNRLQENLSAVRVVKAFARQQYEMEKFEVENYEQFHRGRVLTMMHSLFWPFSDALTSSQLLGGLVLGAFMVINDQITLGQYLAYAGMVRMIIFPIQNLGRLIVQTSTGLVSYDRVMDIVKEEREFLAEDATPPVSDLRGEIVFKNLTFEYETGMPVLRDINFKCEAGQTVALLGATGSGKTSLVNLLARFYDYTTGSITLDGIELREYPRRFLRENIGMVEQEPFLFSLTIRENITYSVGRDVSDSEVEAAARAAQIHDVIMNKFPDGYETLVGERGVTLSGGQKQRVALARTLLKNPRILVLDDATSSVDTGTEAHIRAALKRMMKGRTSFIIAHRIQTVMHADLILVLEHGRIVQTGTHVDLIAQDGVYKRTYEMQSRIDDELEKELASV